jgi:serine/threonine protein kinase
MVTIDLAPGATFGQAGRYQLESMIGAGGMASVWLASDCRLARSVAIKLPAAALALDPEYLARFEREARVAARLSHPHLVSVFDFGVTDERPYLVMEYIDGENLATAIARPSPRPWNPELLVQELLAAVDYIHRCGIVHRDIKPANVLIGSDGHAHLTDFGIAQPADATRLTQIGMIVGSDRYLAPEVRRGLPATAKSDLYACGVLINECLAGGDSRRLAKLARALTNADPARRPSSAAAAIALLGEHATMRRAAVAAPRPATAPTSARQPAPAVVRAPAPTEHRPTARTSLLSAGTARRRREVRPKELAAVAALMLVVVAIGLIAFGLPGGARSRGPSATPANAPLAQQLTSLERAIGSSRR